MSQEQDIIKQKVLAFYHSAKTAFPIKKVLLFGSWAKGNPKEWSDIDVAVVIDEKDHLKRLDIGSRLIHLAFPIDSRIEPKTVFYDEYLHPKQASILSEILATGIEIV
jgi:predicted nucleotidyltransferase